MHGNTFTKNGFKTRDYSTLLEEIVLVNQTLKKAGESLGGVHLESTPDDVTECLGGRHASVGEEDLPKAYTTYCDPRLNNSQCVDLLQELAPQLKQLK
jgi:3-deoxy-7-phosphoheptulonate synthase